MEIQDFLAVQGLAVFRETLALQVERAFKAIKEMLVQSAAKEKLAYLVYLE